MCIDRPETIPVVDGYHVAQSLVMSGRVNNAVSGCHDWSAFPPRNIDSVVERPLTSDRVGSVSEIGRVPALALDRKD